MHAASAESNLLRCDSVEQLSLHAGAGGQPARFNNHPVYTGGVMHPEMRVANNYAGPVVVDVTGIEVAPDLPVNRDHDAKRPVAHCTDVHDDGNQLLASGVFSLDNSDSREITTGRTFPWKPSIGLILLDWRMIREGESLFANGRTFTGPLLFVTRSRLKHIAIVTEPGDTNVDPLILAQHANTGSPTMGFDAWIASLGLDVSTLTPEAKAALQSHYDSMQAAVEEEVAEGSAQPAGTGNPAHATAAASRAATAAATLHAHGHDHIADAREARLAASYRQTIAAEEGRAHGLRTLCARFSNPDVSINGQTVNLAAHAIASGWDVDRTELEARRHNELEATRNSRPHGPAIHSTSRGQRGSIETLQASLLLRANVALDSAHFANPTIRQRLPDWLRAGVNDANRQKIMDQAHEFSGVSMLEACAMSLAAGGHMVPSNRLDMLHASFSSGTVTALFGATLGAQVLVAYAEIMDFSSGWVQERENPDMELHNRNRMEAAGDLTLHPAGGSAAHATRAVKSETSKVDRFSKQLNMDEADFMSDNFGKLVDTPRDFGLAAGRVRPNLVAAIMLANPTLVVTGRALFNTTDVSDLGVGNALARDPLSSAIAKLGLRRDGDASINLQPTHLIVPPQLRDTAVQLCKSDIISNDSGKGNKNVLSEYQIKPVSEPRLANGLVDPVSGAALAGSATDWFLVSAEAHTIEVTTLEGAGKVPIVKSEPLTGGEFGLNVTVRHYVGARAQDFRGFCRGKA